MNRKQALKDLDKHLSVCKTCPKKLNSTWSSPDYNRLQSYCNHKCKTGLKMRKVALELVKITKARRKQKGVSA